ncbi:MAG: hypothetical protein LQ343_007907 [Gyalolechia ehrenbergii]|nr:MAG: hypothetical protein LQ343_007907 [Gyalolechia ehrenbergii]
MTSQTAAAIHAVLVWAWPPDPPDTPNVTKTLAEAATANTTISIPNPVTAASSFIINQIPYDSAIDNGSSFISPIPVLVLQWYLFLALHLLFLLACHFGGRWFGRYLTRPTPQPAVTTPRPFSSALLSPFRYVCSLPKVTMGFDLFLTAYFAYCIWVELAYPHPYGANNYVLSAIRFLVVGPLIALFQSRGQLVKDGFDNLNRLFHCCYARTKAFFGGCKNAFLQMGSSMLAWSHTMGPAWGFAFWVMVDDAKSATSTLFRWLCSIVKAVAWILRLTFSTVLFIGIVVKDFICHVWDSIYIRPRLEAAIEVVEASHKQELREREERILQLVNWKTQAQIREGDAQTREADHLRELETLRIFKWAHPLSNRQFQGAYQWQTRIAQLTQLTPTNPGQQLQIELEIEKLKINEMGVDFRWLNGKYGKLEEELKTKDEVIQRQKDENTHKDDRLKEQDNTIRRHQLQEKTLTDELAESKSASLSKQAQVEELTKQLETQAKQAKSNQEALATAAAKVAETNTKLQEEKDSRAKETARADKAVSANEACQKAKDDLEKKLANVKEELPAPKSDSMDVDDDPPVNSGPSQKAIEKARYTQLFPHGHEPQAEPQIERFFGSFVATVDSMRLQGNPVPSFEDLRDFFNEYQNQINAGIDKPVKYGPLHPEQLARLVRFWGESQGMHLRLGLITGVQGRLEPLVDFDDLGNQTPGLRTVCLFKYVTQDTLEAKLKAPWRALAPLPEPCDDSAEMNVLAPAKYVQAFPKGYGVCKQSDADRHKSGFDALRASIQYQQPGTPVSVEGLIKCYDHHHAQGKLTQRDQNANLTYEQMCKLCLLCGGDQSKKFVLGVVVKVEGREEMTFRLGKNFDQAQTDQKVIWVLKKADNESAGFDEVAWQGLVPKMK